MCSSYQNVLFQERFADEVELKAPFSPALLGQAVYFMYFKNIYLTPRNVQDLLDLASYLQMEKLQVLTS